MHSLIILINNVKHCNICHGLFSNLPLLFHNFIYNNLILPLVYYKNEIIYYNYDKQNQKYTFILTLT